MYGDGILLAIQCMSMTLRLVIYYFLKYVQMYRVSNIMLSNNFASIMDAINMYEKP